MEFTFYIEKPIVPNWNSITLLSPFFFWKTHRTHHLLVIYLLYISYLLHSVKIPKNFIYMKCKKCMISF